MNRKSDLSVRRAGPADADALATLRFEFRASLGAAVEREVEFHRRCAEWMRTHLAEESSWRAWVLQTATESIGTVWLQLLEKLPNPVAEREMHGYVTNLFVRPDYRGNSGGSMLLEAALADCAASGVDTIILWPTARSRPLYERHGFATTNDVMTRVL